MSTSISLVVSSTEECHSFTISSSEELHKYIINNLKVSNFNLITEKGEKINKKNFSKLNDYFTSLNHTLSFLLIPSINQVKTESNGSLAHTVKNTIQNQHKIKSILNFYFKNTIEKINHKLQLLNGLQIKYSRHKDYLETNFIQTFLNFKVFFHLNNDDNIQNDFDIIEQAVKDFKKIATLYQEQLKNINIQAKEIISAYEWNINDHTLREDKEELTLNERVKVRVFNSHLLKNIIEKESDSNKKELLNKIAEITLYKKNLDHHIEITNIPQMFIGDANEIRNEIAQRKNFDLCFSKIMNFIQNSILVKEEERRKKFCETLNLENKNELYTKFINALYENYGSYRDNGKETDKNITEVLRKLDDQLNNLILVLYQEARVSKVNDIPIESFGDMNLNKYQNLNNNTQEFLNSVSLELEKLLKENFKLSQKQNHEELNLPIQDKIMTMIKTVSDKTKAYIGVNDHLIDISDASLAYSILLDEKHQSMQSSPNPNYASMELEKFLNKNEKQLYFYEIIFDYIEAYIHQNKIKLNTPLDKENPQTLGNTIEQLLKDRLTLKKNYNKCISILNQLKNKT